MNAREFVRYAKHDAADWSVDNMMQRLNEPKELPTSKTPFVWLHKKRREIEQSQWFGRLDEQGKANVNTLIQECAELTLFSLFSLLDGVGGDYDGVFEVTAVDAINRTLVNPQNTEMLHDLLSEVCEEEREALEG